MKNEKGFIFSLEAMLSVLVVIAAIAIIGGTLINDNPNKTSFLEIKAQSDAAMGIYFNDANRLAAEDEPNIVCKTIADYNSISGKVFERKFCEGVK